MNSAVLTIVLGLAGGGLMGALANEWFRRKHGKMQSIPLIERVNRAVKPTLRGYVLARKAASGELEEVSNVREYQFTLRNTSSVHFKDLEIQFEFPSREAEGWPERPSKSNTRPEQIAVAGEEDNLRVFRWRIPQFPSSDTIDFTFRSVDPDSEKYDVSLYNSDQVVLKKVDSDLIETRRWLFLPYMGLYLGVLGVGVAFFSRDMTSHGVLDRLVRELTIENLETQYSRIEDDACVLVVRSSASRATFSSDTSEPWKISQFVANEGAGPCTIQLGPVFAEQVVIDAKSDRAVAVSSNEKPNLVHAHLTLGTGASSRNLSIPIYVRK